MDEMEVEVGAGQDGTLFQTEEKIRFLALASALVAAVEKELGDFEAYALNRITEEGEVHFRAEVTGRDVELKIGAAGETSP